MDNYNPAWLVTCESGQEYELVVIAGSTNRPSLNLSVLKLRFHPTLMLICTNLYDIFIICYEGKRYYRRETDDG
jgi:hypothetical protein